MYLVIIRPMPIIRATELCATARKRKVWKTYLDGT